MREIIFQYLMDQKGTTSKIATNICDKLERHPDIMKEFAQYVESGEFPTEGAISVSGYTAKVIFETTFLQPTGAYNYLVYLREEPAVALDKLKRGLPKR